MSGIPAKERHKNLKKSTLDIGDIDFSPSLENTLSQSKLPQKFKNCTFDNYYPDKRYHSQKIVKEKLIEFVDKLEKFKLKKSKPKFLRGFYSASKPKNIYLDGVYGVGKTHLLASLANKYSGKSIFLSFSELTYMIALYTLKSVAEKLTEQFDLILIDEFELDDPGDAMMGINFIREVNRTDSVVVATSNTLPTQLGARKLDILLFKDRIGSLIKCFETYIIDGEDYRINLKKAEFVSLSEDIETVFESYKTKNRAKLIVDFESLLAKLREVHPFRYNQLSHNLDALFIRNIRPFSENEIADALRFSHLIDTLYYGDVDIFISGNCDILNIFHPDLKEGKFKTKIGRCLSRLSEKCTIITRS